MNIPVYANYWGKTFCDNENRVQGYHLLQYHCLDAVFVTHLWWERSGSVRDMVKTCLSTSYSPSQIKAWLLFFIALHDLGKWDIRFQLKSAETWKSLHPNWNFDNDCMENTASIRKYDHGKMGFGVFCRDVHTMAEDYENYYTWLSAVTGHHGTLPDAYCEYRLPQVEDAWKDQDFFARSSWFKKLEEIFLRPESLSLDSAPPELNPEGRSIVAGLCSIADWIASQESLFPYQSEYMEPEKYWNELQRRLQNSDIIGGCGIQKNAGEFGGVEALLKKDCEPRQVQCIVSQLSTEAGLTIIEAPTGCGKTEAGIAYAWKMLASGKAESIVFALPTQATANAMFDRVLAFAEQLFPDGGGNFVLAHGKSMKNHQFQQLCEIGRNNNLLGKEDGKAQCAEWLASSKKRVFLGQVGICTIDQILISVLPVRHSFVRMFGLGRSILLVDEVHAYDAYMYTLLGEVLERQAVVGGSAILLSATLPSLQKKKLIDAWGGKQTKFLSDYPLVTQVSRGSEATVHTLLSDQLPKRRVFQVELHTDQQDDPPPKMLERVIGAAQNGARVGLIFNTVDAAQHTALELRNKVQVPVDLFHSRYMFCDRQKCELEVMEKFGPQADRKQGRILVATQVVEQSLDLDFDWMVTEICPIDLLFQRIGRLHRHLIVNRFTGFEMPKVDVLISQENNYGVTGLIYGDLRLLWRTQKMLEACKGKILFPDAFRSWVEKVYQAKAWGDEPEEIQKAHEEFVRDQSAREYKAKQLIDQYMNPLDDADERVAVLTRDGEMQFSVLLQNENGGLLTNGDGALASNQDRLDDACVPVPGTKAWRGSLPGINRELGLHVLQMRQHGQEAWEAINLTRHRITYSQYLGLRREKL